MVIDGHVHFDGPEAYNALIADMKRTGADQFNVLIYEPQSEDPDAYRQAAGLWLKMKHPDRVYLFGGLDGTGLFGAGAAPEESLTDQLQNLIDCGCDGLKLLLGKPTTRKFYGHSLDSAVYKPLLDMLERTGFPVLWHVADPPEFWSENTVPLWAKQNRWWYDETHPTKATIDREIAGVFAAHPKLNLILPHFFFHSDRLKDAAALFVKYPNMCFDLAPGVEMLHNFTANHAASREFFIRFADRIVFGTDIGIDGNRTGPERGPMIRRFLETDERFQVPDDPFMTPDPRPDLHGLKLPKEALEQIYHRNFQHVVGSQRPKAMNQHVVKSALEKMAAKARSRGSKKPLAAQVLADMPLF
jgi:predicted TIM-barrel fold metal-dependent hydrolase